MELRPFFGLYGHFGALSWENWKNKATFITEPKKVFIVKVPLFLQFEHV